MKILFPLVLAAFWGGCEKPQPVATPIVQKPSPQWEYKLVDYAGPVLDFQIALSESNLLDSRRALAIAENTRRFKFDEITQEQMEQSNAIAWADQTVETELKFDHLETENKSLMRDTLATNSIDGWEFSGTVPNAIKPSKIYLVFKRQK